MEKVVLCEIDPLVVEVSKQFLPTISCELDNPRLEIVITDGIEYLKRHQKKFDVIITDSSDPLGPAQKLYEFGYYTLLRDSLNPNGIIASQGLFEHAYTCHKSKFFRRVSVDRPYHDF